ncbi:MAG: hypothetical protein BA865_04740 [Desulfobacterales bacterium S5133MH4]|nr:MAG: hypothetical protein BA865_04740 [Desulfobacterales bacterium S5133MH4]
MKYDTKVAWIIWTVLVVVLSVIVLCRFASLASGQAAGLDAVVFLVLVGLLLAPMFPHVELFGLTLRRQIEEKFDDVKNQINGLSATIQSQININLAQGTTDLRAKPAEKVQATVTPERSAMEHKILKTFWTQQVNRYDKWLKGKVWTFRINSGYPPSIEFLEWRKAATKLLVEGISMETTDGQIHLTPQGFEYCKNHYKEFGEEAFWPEQTIKEEMLKKVLAQGGI